MLAEVSNFNVCFEQEICVFWMQALQKGEATLDKRKNWEKVIASSNE